MNQETLGNERFVALETFRKSGAGVITPVWVVNREDALRVWTAGQTGKVKRIRNNGRVRIAPCDARGNLKGEWQEAHARLIDNPADEEQMRRDLAAKYGIQYRLIRLWTSLFQRDRQSVVIAISESVD